MKYLEKDWSIVVRRATSISGGVVLTAVSLIALTLSASARGGHESEPAFASDGMHGAQFAGGRRHGNDSHIKAATEERDRLLNTQLKSICRGC
jgi:hypothetical protein